MTTKSTGDPVEYVTAPDDPTGTRFVPATSALLYEREITRLNERIELLLNAIHEPTRFLLERGWTRDDFEEGFWFEPNPVMRITPRPMDHAIRIAVHQAVEHPAKGSLTAQPLRSTEGINRELPGRHSPGRRIPGAE